MTVRHPLPAAGLILSLLGTGVAGYLTFEHGRGAAPICGFGQGCQVVAQSAYAGLWGIPTAAFGLIMYLSLGVLYSVRLFSPPPATVEGAFRLAALALTVSGTGVSAWLTYVELYVLHAVCVWCVVSAVVVTLLLFVAGTDALRRQAAPRPLSSGRRFKPNGGAERR